MHICNDFDFNNLKNSYRTTRASIKVFHVFERKPSKETVWGPPYFRILLMEHPFLKTGRGGHLRPRDTYPSSITRCYKSYKLNITNQMFIFQLTHLLRSRSNFFQNVTGCDKFERDLSAANFMNKIPISRRRSTANHGEERKRERTELVKFRGSVWITFYRLEIFLPARFKRLLLESRDTLS